MKFIAKVDNGINIELNKLQVLSRLSSANIQISVIRTNLVFVFGFVAVVFFVGDVVFGRLNDDAEATPEQEG